MGLGWGLRKVAPDALACSGGALVLRAAAVDRAALVAAGEGSHAVVARGDPSAARGSPVGVAVLFQRLLEQPESLDAWEQGALARAAGAFERIVTLDPARPIQLILRISRGAPPSTRSLRRPVDDVLAFAA
jgi:hypothetical protein